MTDKSAYLRQLEAESIHILREVAAESSRPVMLYSIGKDSGVMLHLARKAFYPARPPFPLLHVDTTWTVRALYEFRDAIVTGTCTALLLHGTAPGATCARGPLCHR